MSIPLTLDTPRGYPLRESQARRDDSFTGGGMVTSWWSSPGRQIMGGRLFTGPAAKQPAGRGGAF